MASKIEVEKRRSELKNFMIENGNKKIKFDDINNFYETFKDIDTGDLIYKNLSEDTKRKDLYSIEATCRKKNSNTYRLDCFDELEELHLSIKNILSNCIVSKPMLYASSFNNLIKDTNNKNKFKFKDDINQDLNIYSIIVYSKEHDKTTILSFYSQLKKLFDIYSDSVVIGALNTQIFEYHIEFTFVNYNNLEKFYNRILKIQTYEIGEDFMEKYTL